MKLLPRENVTGLLKLGVSLVRPGGTPARATSKKAAAWSLPQPCAAFDGCRCRLYADRPEHCRTFECALLKRVTDGTCSKTQALNLIRVTRTKAATVADLLRAMGDTNESMALADRFRNTVRRLEREPVSKAAAALHSRLTLAFHELVLALGRDFYPAPGRS